jgi:eukaryotic-like serine/threonine-protein kinase
MNARIMLTVTHGIFAGARFVFEEVAHCTLGRAEDCNIRVPTDNDHGEISRHHCVFDIDPPIVRVRDLGSVNGTYINGLKIGSRAITQTPEEVAVDTFPAWDLQDGDEVRVGRLVLRVAIDTGWDRMETMGPVQTQGWP